MSDGAPRQAVRLMVAAILLGSLCATCAAPAEADDSPGAPGPGGSWISRSIAEQPLTGSWFGARDVLAGWGITPTLWYGTDLMASVAGGQQRGQGYAGQLAVGAKMDLGKLAGLKGLSFDVSMNWSSGTDLSRDIGNTFTVAQYFDGSEVRLTNMFLQQSLFDDRINLTAGRISTGADFLTAPINLSFVNEALNPILLAVQENVPGVTANPNVTWGGRVIARPAAAWSLSAGAFYSDPSLDQLTANGTEFGISGSAGYFVIAEVAYLLNADTGAAGLPGRYRVGGYYDSNRYAQLDNPGRQHTGNYGLFVVGEQMVYRAGGPGSEKGLSLVGALIYAPQESINTLPWFASAGASYQGLVPGRDRDTAAFGLYFGGFSRNLPGQTYELVLEWTYAISFGRRLTVQPDLQYVINPGGASSVGNAVVVGIQLAVEF